MTYLRISQDRVYVVVRSCRHGCSHRSEKNLICGFEVLQCTGCRFCQDEACQSCKTVNATVASWSLGSERWRVELDLLPRRTTESPVRAPNQPTAALVHHHDDTDQSIADKCSEPTFISSDSSETSSHDTIIRSQLASKHTSFAIYLFNLHENPISIEMASTLLRRTPKLGASLRHGVFKPNTGMAGVAFTRGKATLPDMPCTYTFHDFCLNWLRIELC